MEADKIICELETQVRKKDRLAGGDPESEFTEEAAILTSAANLLKAYTRTGLAPADIQKAVDIINDAIQPDSLPVELKRWVERCTWHVRKCTELHSENVELSTRITQLQEDLSAAKTDIGALLWLDGRCEYCQFARKEEYNGAVRWGCKFGSTDACRPKWKGNGEEPEPPVLAAKETRANTHGACVATEAKGKEYQHSQLRGLMKKLSDVLEYEPVDSDDEVENEIWLQANGLLESLNDFFKAWYDNQGILEGGDAKIS